ncbi:MAG: hypothetical protein WEB58_17265 [Planctomycetaceae bacterium]
MRKQNHCLDALYNACAAGSLAGVRLIGSSIQVISDEKGMEPSDGFPAVAGALAGGRSILEKFAVRQSC